MRNHSKDSCEQRRTVLVLRRRRARRRPRLRRRRRTEYLRTSNLLVFVPSFRTTERIVTDICFVFAVSPFSIIDTAYASKSNPLPILSLSHFRYHRFVVISLFFCFYLFFFVYFYYLKKGRVDRREILCI